VRRTGRPPKCPYTLGKAGQDWWKWAWSLPQTAAWDDGSLYALARRAQLEDDLAILDQFEPFDIADFLGIDESEAVKQLAFVIGRIKSMAGGRLGVLKEMRELDKRFGLDPKALAENRWEIVPEKDDKPAAAPRAGAKTKDRRARLTVVR
jgi:hypothetical protein